MATPTITSISGTVSAGQSIAITGTYMMDENKTDWLSHFTSGTAYGFEGASYTADGYARAPDEMEYGTGGYDTEVKLSGSKSIYGTCTSTAKTGYGYELYMLDDYNEDDVYVRFYTRWSSTGTCKWPNNYIKMTMCGGGQQMYMQPASTDGTELPTQMVVQWYGGSQLCDVDNFLIDGRWYCMEVRYKYSSPTQLTAWVDGVQIHNQNNPVATASEISVVWFGLVNMYAQSSTFNLTEWIDNLAISTSRVYPSCVAEIGNSNLYESATRVYQAPTSLEDTSGEFTVDLSGLGNPPYYLWITNNRQERSDAFHLKVGKFIGTNNVTVSKFMGVATSGVSKINGYQM